MDNVLVQRGAWTIHLPYSHSYCSTPMSMYVSIAIPNLHKSLFMTWDGLKTRGKQHKHIHITVACHIGGTPARDRKMEAGKYMGRMLGALPPKYLRWMVRKKYPDAAWSAMAEEVLEDPVYRDRTGLEILNEPVKGSLFCDNDETNIKSNANDSEKAKSESDIRREARRERQRLRRGPVKPQLKEKPRPRRILPGRGALLKLIRDAESETLNQKID